MCFQYICVDLSEKDSSHLHICARSARHFCESMWPKLSRQRSLERNLCLADGLLEIKRQEEDTVFLSEDLSMILGDAEKMLQEYSEQPK